MYGKLVYKIFPIPLIIFQINFKKITQFITLIINDNINNCILF